MKCFVCKKEFDGGFQDASGNKYCSRECLNYKDSFNYGIKVIIEHRLNCMNYLPISNKGKELLTKHINSEELFNDAVTIGKEKGIISERDIALSIARGMVLPSVAPVTSEKKPGVLSSEADLKIYGYKLASIKARVKYTESLLKTLFNYENVVFIANEKTVDFKQITAKRNELKYLETRYREQRNALFRKLAEKAGASNSDIESAIASTVVKQAVKGAAKGAIKLTNAVAGQGGQVVIGLGGVAETLSALSIPISGLLAVGGVLHYLYNRKNRIIAEGIAEAQALYTKRLSELNNKFNSLMAESNSINQGMDRRIQEINEEIVASEMAIAQYKLDIAMFSEMENISN